MRDDESDGDWRRSSLLQVLTIVWRNDALRRLQLAYVTFNCGELATWLAMLVYAYDQGGVTESGLLATVLLVPAAVFAPVVGPLFERRGGGRLLFDGYVAQALSCALAAVALYVDPHPLIVYFLFLWPALAFTMTRPTQSSFAPALARTPDELTATNVVSGWIVSLSTLAGPGLTGVVLAFGSPGTVYLLVAVACLAGAVLVAPLRRIGMPHDAAIDPEDDLSFVGSLSFVRRDPHARVLLLLLTAQCIAIGALDILAVELAVGVLGRGEDWAGYLQAAFGAGGVLAVVVTARLVGMPRLAFPLVLSLVVWSAAFVSLAALPGAFVALALLVVAGGGQMTFDVAGMTLLQRVARADLLARVFGLLEGLQMAAYAAGSLLVPVLAALFGVPATFVGVGAVLPLVALVAGRRLLDIDRHATVPVVEIALLRSVPLFASLAPPTLESLARGLEPVTVQAGSDVLREGEEGDRFYVIADGEVEIVRDGRTVATRARGEGFGEIALIHDVPRTATVRATRDARLYALDREAFLLAVTGHPATRRSAHDLAAERLEELRVHDAPGPALEAGET